MTITLTPSERHSAREIWHMLQNGQDDDSSGYEAFQAASENIQSAIAEAAGVSKIAIAFEENPFL